MCDILIYNIAVLIGVFLFLTIKQFIFNDTVQWLGNIGTSIFAMLLYIYINWFQKKNEK
ncbi:membrane transport family protein [Oceanobacillus picturae]|uniref:Membrane transport family protein n=1 Tax=Oceanobacillus picturae TaxID=171693 RepID=A0A0U9H741_9BACI|nr:membrane transport family protein [Oceanobacillus picturae]